MTFKEATDRLVALGLRAEDFAEALGLTTQYVRMMRMREDATAYRSPPPPEVWRPKLAALARERAEALTAFAREAD